MNKTVFPVIIAVILSVTLSWALWGRNGNSGSGHSETAYERVLRTRVLRCGYYVYPPVTYRDMKTGKMSGLSVDMIEHIAKRAGLKVEWTQEVSFGDWPEGLKAKRFDLACTPMWPDTAIGQVVYFTRPFFYAGIYPIGRGNETRFKTLDDLNNPSVTIATQDGNEIQNLARVIFPKTKIVSIVANAGGNMVAQDVMNRKADFMLSDKNLLREINGTNPNALKVLIDQPVKVMPFTLAVSVGEDAFLQFINNATDEILLTGEMDRLLEKWVEKPTPYMTVSPVWNAHSAQ